MKKFIFNILIISVLLMICTSCTKNGGSVTPEAASEAAETDTDRQKELVSREYFLEHCGKTEEELKGVDIDWFISYYQVTEDSFSTASFKTSLRNHIAFANPVEEYNEEYKYIRDVPLSRYETDMLEDIRLIYIVYEHEGNMNTYLFDFDNKRVCGFNLDFIRDSTDEDKEKLLKLIRESGIENITDTYLKGKPEKEQEYKDNYELYIETNDGRTAHLKGEIIIPEEFKKLVGGTCEKIQRIADRK